jgi:hypothetical protein
MTKSASQRRVAGIGETDSLVREIARLGAAVARSRLKLDGDQLSADELRGYVRARAIGPVRLLAHQLAAKTDHSSDLTDQLAARALERTVHLVVRGMQSRPIVAATPACLPLRRAA